MNKYLTIIILTSQVLTITYKGMSGTKLDMTISKMICTEAPKLKPKPKFAERNTPSYVC